MDVSFWSICLMKALRVLRFIEDSLLRGREKSKRISHHRVRCRGRQAPMLDSRVGTAMREVGTSVFEQYGLVDARAGVQSLAQRAYRGDVAVGRPIVIAHVHERDCEGDEALLAQTGDEALRVANVEGRAIA